MKRTQETTDTELQYKYSFYILYTANP